MCGRAASFTRLLQHHSIEAVMIDEATDFMQIEPSGVHGHRSGDIGDGTRDPYVLAHSQEFPFPGESEFSHNRHASDANHAAAWPFVHPRRGSTIDHFHELDSVTEGIGRAPLPNLTSFYNLVRFFSFECN